MAIDARRMTALRGVIEDCIASNTSFEEARQRLLSALGVVGTRLPIDRYGRRPAFFADVPVREMLIELHREVTIAAARETCRERFGAERTPSRSAIARFWIYLDRLQRRQIR